MQEEKTLELIDGFIQRGQLTMARALSRKAEPKVNAAIERVKQGAYARSQAHNKLEEMMNDIST